MANSLDKLIVLDLESTCWEKPPAERLPESEIIEIGICVIDLSSWAIEDKESILVLPEKSTVSDFCTSLTTLTQDVLDEHGITFQKACTKLRDKYKTHHRLWASWGDYDRRQFERQCRRERYKDVRYPFGPSHLNLKNLFAVAMGLSREVGMDKALEMLNMDLEGTHHRGVDDACNIAKIACHLFKSLSWWE